MYTLTIGKTIVKRYKVQWHSNTGRHNYVKKTAILHGASLDKVKAKAAEIYGDVPDSIHRI